MAEKKVTVRLNQQQWELVDKSVAEGVAASRDELIKMALREYGRDHAGSAGGGE
jgi:Arc/MetJ-type ribon-helix-helix transcriptional regulator